MIKYLAVASAFKIFSVNSKTRWAYRQLGNTLGQRGLLRKELHGWQMKWAREILALINKHQLIRDGEEILELGTGWVHWQSTIIRLFFDVKVTLFDVWDNRQFLAYQRTFRRFGEVMDKELGLTTAQSERARRVLDIIRDASSFEEVYQALGFTYVIQEEGSLSQFADRAFSCVYSCNVFEHVKRESVPGMIKGIARVLKPGGYSLQSVDMGDHIAYYDTKVFRKNYLGISNALWKHFYENEVQYFNRIQRAEWLDYFSENGFKLIEEHANPVNLDHIKVHKDFAQLSRTDLECLNMTVIHKKPDF
jgi:ubiquinone/menaquinone biosynthesis C-methylase UbiE